DVVINSFDVPFVEFPEGSLVMRRTLNQCHIGQVFVTGLLGCTLKNSHHRYKPTPSRLVTNDSYQPFANPARRVVCSRSGIQNTENPIYGTHSTTPYDDRIGRSARGMFPAGRRKFRTRHAGLPRDERRPDLSAGRDSGSDYYATAADHGCVDGY